MVICFDTSFLFSVYVAGPLIVPREAVNREDR